ncbi:hypothetical protein [Fibrella arboris]|uniref:hypothetical protein n=1 Tax=Fibrella arboris TaxID=3242486 RepID=UPI0035225650
MLLLSLSLHLLFTIAGSPLTDHCTLILVTPWLWVNGMTIWPFVLVKRPNPSAQLLNHERIHLRQQLELGIVPFYLWYFAEYGYWRARGLAHYDAYRAICFEREAFANEGNLMYLNKRRFWAFLL